VVLNDSRSKLKEFSSFKGMRAEIQVRTLLQHTWASIDWKFRYKEEREAPRELRRRLFRISALLEAADNEFSSVKHEIERIREQYSKSIGKGNLDIAINTESVLSYINESDIAKEVISAARKAGIMILEASDSQPLNWLVSTLEIIGITSLRDSDNRLRQLAPEATVFFKYVSDWLKEENPLVKRALVRPAMLRYLLLRSVSPDTRKEVARKYAPVTGCGEAIASYAAQPGNSASS
jgi:putative GTP pyrophosphokinase